MTASARGLVMAAGTAAIVLVVGLVFVFGVGQPTPPEKTAAARQPDESDLSLEARRHARLAQSQAMLGGGRAAPSEQQPAPETDRSQPMLGAEPEGPPEQRPALGTDGSPVTQGEKRTMPPEQQPVPGTDKSRMMQGGEHRAPAEREPAP